VASISHDQEDVLETFGNGFLLQNCQGLKCRKGGKGKNIPDYHLGRCSSSGQGYPRSSAIDPTWHPDSGVDQDSGERSCKSKLPLVRESRSFQADLNGRSRASAIVEQAGRELGRR